MDVFMFFSYFKNSFNLTHKLKMKITLCICCLSVTESVSVAPLNKHSVLYMLGTHGSISEF